MWQVQTELRRLRGRPNEPEQDSGHPPRGIDFLFAVVGSTFHRAIPWRSRRSLARTRGALLTSPDVRLISFTGSACVAKAIAGKAATTLTRLAFERDGTDAMIVMEDADLSAAAEAVVQGRAYQWRRADRLCGQTSVRALHVVRVHRAVRLELRPAILVAPGIVERDRSLDLIRFRGHLPKGGYDVRNGRSEKPASAPAVYG